MSNKVKKVAALGLSLATVSFFAGNILLASAQTTSIQDLLNQITALQAQITKLQGTAATTSSSFAKDLTLGSKGDDVKALQQFLNSKGYTIAASGAGSVGNESTYFGSKTAAALAKYQKAVGISPAAGYFGPKTRAYVNSLAAGTTGTTTTTSTTTGGTVIVAPSTGLAVSLASDNPAAGSLISGASRVEVLKLNFTAGTAGAATITGFKFTKTGVLSDTAINNAYLIESGKVIAQFSSISGGVITFSGLNLGVNAGQTRTFSLGIDPASGLTAGNTVAFALMSADNVTSVDSSNNVITETGKFPFQGNTQTITSVANPSIATLTVASSSVGSSVNAGTTGVLVSQWTLTAANSKVNLKSIKFSVVGSASKSDIKNIMLKVNGIQVGSTLPTLASDGSAYFDLTSTPATIQTGSSNMQVYADIMGSPSFNFDFGILNTFDVLGIDTTYNSPVAITVNGGGTTSTGGHSITINTGSITVNAASDTPTGSIALNASGATLAKYTIYAAGEAVKVKFLDYKLTFTGTTGTISTIVKNISLVDDAGGQVGSTNSTPPTSNACAQGTAGYLSSSVFGDCFGTSASPINYIVPANTTRTFSLKGDIQSTAAFTTVTASLSGNTSNLQGLTSSQSASSGSVNGAALTLATTPLTAGKNNAFSTQTYAAGGPQAVKIGSYILSASAAEGVNVSNLTITMSSSSTNFQNLMVKVGGTQFGLTTSKLSGSDAVTFSGNQFLVSVGGTQTVDVYANVLGSSATTTFTGLTTLTSCTGTGATTNSSISCSPTSVAGQNVIISSGPTITASLDTANSSLSKQVIIGTTGNSLATFQLRETSNLEPIKISTLIIRQNVSATSSVKTGFSNLTLYSSTAPSTPLATAALVDGGSTAATYKATFNFGNVSPLVVPQNGSVSITLKGDVSDINSITDNSTSTFSIATSTDITAIGSNSNGSATVTLSSTTGNTMTTLRSRLTLSATALGSSTGRGKASADNLATLNFNAGTSGDVLINTISLKFVGLAVSNGTSIVAQLVNGGTGGFCGSAAMTGTTQQTVTSGAGNSGTVNFAFSTPLRVPANTSVPVCVQVNSNNFLTNISQTSVYGLNVTVNAASDVNWGEDTTTTGLSLDSTATAIPFSVASIGYGQQ